MHNAATNLNRYYVMTYIYADSKIAEVEINSYVYKKSWLAKHGMINTPAIYGNNALFSCVYIVIRSP